jgi:hypothetical protein
MRLHDLLDACERKHLARTVRKHARKERDRRLEAGAVDSAAVSARTALYEQIAVLVEDVRRPLGSTGLQRVRSHLHESPPLADYGLFARARNERVASILSGLEQER